MANGSVTELMPAGGVLERTGMRAHRHGWLRPASGLIEKRVGEHPEYMVLNLSDRV